MFKTVHVGNKDLDLLATASTTIRYKQVFREDLIVKMAAMEENEASDFLDIAQKLAYVMSAQAAKEDMMKLSYDGYIEFLDEFDPLDFVVPGQDIISVYRMNESGTSEAKKKEEQQNEN